GRIEGKFEGKLEVAHSLLKMGMSHESVQEATGLTEEELAQIRH
ncbi:ISNCY family transposase, partial [Salmonella enterica subsp. enterica serovar Kintambo]|nr:ISNCY family transposase [Salmonella enterica subsp. enterica serovar Kintambo]